MYYPNSIEDICYENEHIERVLTEIKGNFHDYFQQFIETESGQTIDRESIKKLAEKLGARFSDKNRKINMKDVYERIITEGIESYKKDRQKYLAILDLDALREYEDDPSYFKNTILRNKCPIIHHTLQNKKAKELDKYRADFQVSDPGELLSTVTNLTKFALQYNDKYYNPSSHEKIDNVNDLMFSDLRNEEYIVYGIIGGGIKSHFLFKLFPEIFPNRSRESLWALWYLTSKKPLGCEQDSEFLMIDLKDNVTQQNYFYPYDLFSFYALRLFLLLKKEASRLSVSIPTEYRYVLPDTFLSFITQQYIDEIDELKKKITDDGYGY